MHIWVILSIRIYPHQLFGRSTPPKKIIDICGKGVILFVGRLNKNKKLQAGHAMNAPLYTTGTLINMARAQRLLIGVINTTGATKECVKKAIMKP
jgi:hypothetical protein